MSEMDSKNKFYAVFDAYKKVKRTGNFRRKLKKRVNELTAVRPLDKISIENQQSASDFSFPNVDDDICLQTNNNWVDSDSDDDCCNSTIEEISNDPTADATVMQKQFRSALSTWAIQYHINQQQLRGLLQICNGILPFQLPIDPRTIIQTPRFVEIEQFSNGGLYWHRGLKQSLCSKLENLPKLPRKISLNINVDGLPISKSSNKQFWPILFNIHELHSIEPGTVGIYCGTSK